MIMIEIAPIENGAHRNQSATTIIPVGWAIVPDDVEIPNTFPFVDLTVENGVVTAMTAGVVPQFPDPQTEPSEQDDVNAMLVDHELRLTLLELGVE